MLAPSFCPRCKAENSFSVLDKTLLCRRCGYAIPREKMSKPASRPSAPVEGYGPREPVRPSYALSHPDPVDRWAQAAYETGQHHVHRKEWAQAVQAFQRAIESEPYFVDAHFWIALLVRDPALKREHLEHALASLPGHVGAIREMMILNGHLDANADVLNPHIEPELCQAGGAVATETHNLRCPQCSSPNLATDDVTGLMICDSCGYSEKAAVVPAGGSDMLTAALLQRRAQPVRWVVGERLLQCESCGAERTIPARTLSMHCPFCGSNHVIERDVLESFQQPDGVVGFRISRKDAGDAIKARLGGISEKIMGLFQNNRVTRATLDGVFLPYWVFDAAVQVTRRVDRSRDVTQEISLQQVYETTRLDDMAYNIAICAAKAPSSHLTSRLGDFDFSVVEAYRPELLATYPAEIYSLDFDTASIQARKCVGSLMRQRHSGVSTGSVIVNVFANIQQMWFRLLLLPVWVATLHEADGDVRTALVNGQSGQVILGRAKRNVNTML